MELHTASKPDLVVMSTVDATDTRKEMRSHGNVDLRALLLHGNVEEMIAVAMITVKVERLLPGLKVDMVEMVMATEIKVDTEVPHRELLVEAHRGNNKDRPLLLEEHRATVVMGIILVEVMVTPTDMRSLAWALLLDLVLLLDWALCIRLTVQLVAPRRQLLRAALPHHHRAKRLRRHLPAISRLRLLQEPEPEGHVQDRS